MFLLVLMGSLPSEWREANALTYFFLTHPQNAATVQYMNLYDLGVPAFFSIIGLLMAVSFKKRVESKGNGPAVLHALVRWGLVSVVGILFIIIPAVFENRPVETWFGEMKTIAPGVIWYVVTCDVVIALGFVGLACIPFLFVPRNYRLIISYAMMSFYQVMIFIPETHWRDYAVNSAHGGILGGIFVMIPITLIASVIGEFSILDKETPAAEKAKKSTLLGLVNAIIGLVLWLIPGGYPNKVQSTMSWATISLAVCIFVGHLFVKSDYKDEDFPKMNPFNKARIVLFKSYGMNPFLIYVIAGATKTVIKALVGSSFEISLIGCLIMVPAITMIAYLLYRKGKAISTTEVALAVIIIIVALSIIIIPFL